MTTSNPSTSAKGSVSKPVTSIRDIPMALNTNSAACKDVYFNMSVDQMSMHGGVTELALVDWLKRDLKFVFTSNWTLPEDKESNIFKPFSDAQIMEFFEKSGMSVELVQANFWTDRPTCIRSAQFDPTDNPDISICFDRTVEGLTLIIATNNLTNREKIVEVIKRFKKLTGERVETKKEDEVDIAFWVMGQNGPRYVFRTVTVPSWAEIKENYSSNVADTLSAVIKDGKDVANSGRLILWHGKPGTGKTYAIRSLIRAWSDWSNVHFIVDPENFFIRSADYMTRVLLDNEAKFSFENLRARSFSDIDPLGFQGMGSSSQSKEKQPWDLFILEDSGEFISKDAKGNVGQGLARLLNLIDGLIGQGLNYMVLLTTNEELGALNEAVTRQGRCAVNLEFTSLSNKEATAWLKERGSTYKLDNREYILSELYSILNENKFNKVSTGSGKLGFS